MLFRVSGSQVHCVIAAFHSADLVSEGNFINPLKVLWYRFSLGRTPLSQMSHLLIIETVGFGLWGAGMSVLFLNSRKEGIGMRGVM